MTWLRYRLIERPYYDAAGNILATIAGLANEPGKSEFTGGGWVYPEIPGRVLESRELAGELLSRVDATEEEALAAAARDETFTWAASPKVERVARLKDFNAEVLSEPAAQARILELWPPPVVLPADNTATEVVK